MGVVTTIRARHWGQVAGGLITVTTLTTHRQKLPLPAKGVLHGLPQGRTGEEDWAPRGPPEATVRPP